MLESIDANVTVIMDILDLIPERIINLSESYDEYEASLLLLEETTTGDLNDKYRLLNLIVF